MEGWRDGGMEGTFQLAPLGISVTQTHNGVELLFSNQASVRVTLLCN